MKKVLDGGGEKCRMKLSKGGKVSLEIEKARLAFRYWKRYERKKIQKVLDWMNRT